jgi:4-amino-4-deoxy-L-arabinose transferase-like glycosyltransferase/membrane-associated phospholipid phosphatase
MPVLSGNVFFFPFLILLVIALLWKGGRRMRVCVLMLALILPLGDSLVCNTLKHAVGRPRPFVTLPEARRFGKIGDGYVPPGTVNNSNHNSMPSSHAANWFAATMIFFVYYRRSLRFMLPLALGVSFSRVYNGMHYPSDVIAGAIIGAGYGAAFLILFELAWKFIGKKFFPLWHAQLPSLLKPEVRSQKSEARSGNLEPATFNSQLSPLNQQWLRLGYLVIFIMLIARWLYLASGIVDLSGDEAYQWVWSKHLALSYYSKPPGIALIQFTGTSIFSDTEFGVRFFSPLFAAIMGVMMLRFFAREISARAGFLFLLIVTATPLLDLGTILMTIDPPMVLCWMWALVAGWRAAQPDGKTRDWLVVGLAMGVGFLCKYTAACQIVCWAIFFALAPAARLHLRKPGPWLALLVFLVCTTPVVIWNAQHGWITIHHVAGDAGLHSNWKPADALRYFPDFTWQEALLLNPFFFIGALWAMIGFWKFRRERPLWLYFFCMGTPLFLGYWLYSFHSRVQPNWIAPAVLPMFGLMFVYWNERRQIAKPFLAAALVLGFIATAIMHQSTLIGKITGRQLPDDIDPTHRAQGWRPTAALVEAAREKLESEGKPAFIIADHYGLTGQLSFYLPQAHDALKSQPLVYCVDSDEPVNQFYFWPEYNYLANRKGENAIYATELNPYPLESGWFWKWLKHEPVNYAEIPPPHAVPPRMANEFASVTNLGVQEIKVNGHVFRRVQLWACYNLK